MSTDYTAAVREAADRLLATHGRYAAQAARLAADRADEHDRHALADFLSNVAADLDDRRVLPVAC